MSLFSMTYTNLILRVQIIISTTFNKTNVNHQIWPGCAEIFNTGFHLNIRILSNIKGSNDKSIEY